MKIALFVDDFYSGKGVNYEVYMHHEALLNEKSLELIIFSYGKSKPGVIKKVDSPVISIDRKLSWKEKVNFIAKALTKNKVDIVQVLGFASANVLCALKAAKRTKVKVVMSPYSQLTEFNFNNKLFFEDPDLKSIEKNGPVAKTSNQKISELKSKLKKRLFFKVLAKKLLKNIHGIRFISDFEQQQYSKYYRNKIISKIICEPAQPQDVSIQENENVFSKDQINIVYWGRIDFGLKGLDRLVDYVLKNKELLIESKVKFHIMGPDYNGGLKNILRLIENHKLASIIEITDESVWKGTKQPLMQADYSVLLSKWDGYPRSLRESIQFNVPIIVSKESNFGGFTKEFNLGFEVNSSADLKDIIPLLNKNHVGDFKNAQQKLTCSSWAKEMKELYDLVLN